MGNLGNAKILGGIGAIIMLVGGLVTQFLSIIGFIMVLVAVKYISDEYKDKTIFNNYLYFVILNIIAVVALVASIFIAVGGISFFSAISSGEVTDPTAFIDSLETFLAICIIGFIIFYVLNIIAALYLKKSFESIAKYTGTDMFKTAGLVYFIGAILIIIVFGFFIIFIAQILMIIAFFSLPDQAQQAGAPGAQPVPGQPAYPQQPQQPGRVCPNCGRPIPMDAQVCPYCGKDFRQQ